MINTNISKIILFLVLWMSMGWLSISQAQTVNEYAPADTLEVGDTFDFSITLNRDQEYDEIIFPDSSSFSSDNFEVRSQSQFKVSSYKDSVHYQLQFFGTADTMLPELPVLLIQEGDTTTLHTSPVPIAFRSVLARDDDAFRPLKPIYEFAIAWWPYIAAFILLGIAAYFLYSYLSRKEEQPSPEPRIFTPVPFENPLKALQHNIGRLEDAELVTHEDFKHFYIDLGDAIRQYFEDLHHIPALESTSREIIQSLNAKSIDKRLVDETRTVLQEADMVKFAKFTPTNKQAEEALHKAKLFLQRAKEIDSPRVEHLRREHQAAMEEKRERFEQEQNTEKVDT